MENNNRILEELKDVAGVLNIKIGSWTMGKTVLYYNLREIGILSKGAKKNIPFDHYRALGYFEVKKVYKNNHLCYERYLTEKGLNWLVNIKIQPIIENELKYWEKYYPEDFAKFVEGKIQLSIQGQYDHYTGSNGLAANPLPVVTQSVKGVVVATTAINRGSARPPLIFGSNTFKNNYG